MHEDAATRELRLIYESQAGIYKILQQMEHQLQEIGQKQLAAAPPQGGQQQGGAVQQAVGGGFTFNL